MYAKWDHVLYLPNINNDDQKLCYMVITSSTYNTDLKNCCPQSGHVYMMCIISQ